MHVAEMGHRTQPRWGRNIIPLPDIAIEPFLKLWEQKIFALLVKEGKIKQEVVDSMRCWKHSGFSVNNNVLIKANDKAGLERLVQYEKRGLTRFHRE